MYVGLPGVIGMLQSPSPDACFACHIKGHQIGGKCIYPNFWRYLPSDHNDRATPAVDMNKPMPTQQREGQQQRIKAGQKQKGVRPPVLTGPPPLRTATELRPESEYLANNHEAKLKSEGVVLWRLPYYFNMGPPLLCSYDAMHTIAGVVEDIFSLIGPSPVRLKQYVKEYEMHCNG
jgi:hypothetical protein